MSQPEEQIDVVNSPDSLKKDPESLEFYILRDEKVVVCRDRRDVQYWKNRSTYLSSGRFSPEFKKVVFWPGPVNPSRSMDLLKEYMYIDDTYTYAIADSAVRTPKLKKESPLEKLDGVRKRSIEVMIEKGMRVQKNESEGDVNKKD